MLCTVGLCGTEGGSISPSFSFSPVAASPSSPPPTDEVGVSCVDIERGVWYAVGTLFESEESVGRGVTALELRDDRAARREGPREREGRKEKALVDVEVGAGAGGAREGAGLGAGVGVEEA